VSSKPYCAVFEVNYSIRVNELKSKRKEKKEEEEEEKKRIPVGIL
jgi:hypothetical protein